MPHSAALLRGGAACLSTARRAPKPQPPRLVRSAAAAQDHAAAASHGHELPQHVAEPQHDGTVIYHFGGDAEVAAAHAAAPAASAVAAAAHLQQAPQAVAVLPQSAPSQRQVASVQLPALLPRAPPGSSSKDESSGPGASGGGRRHHYLGQEQQQAAHANGSAAPRHAARHRGLASAVVAPKAAQQRDRGSRPPRRRKDGPSRNSPSADWDASLAAPNARSLGDYKQAQLAAILATYEAACERRDLDDALTLVKECVRAGRSDVLGRLKHYRFLRPAATVKAVAKALRFVQLLPRQYADARTYNMLLRVCAEAGDLRNAMHVADMLQAAGLKMDSILYTTLISACAAAGDAEQAFQLYGQMKAEGVTADKMVYSAVVKACAEQIDRLPASERRKQLVLLERAFALIDDLKCARIPTDAAVWNALVTAAGRAGQLQRAFNVLEDMLGSGTRPNDWTYASLIDACARAGDKALALRVYRKAQREGCGSTLMVYSAAVYACIQASGGCDSDEAMNIYSDMQRNGVVPDNQFYGMLMRAAGAHGDLDSVLGLQAEMRHEGLRPCAGTSSALIAVFIRNDCLTEAQSEYRMLRAAGQWPDLYALNALLNAYANRFRLGDVVSLVCEMAEGGLRPDAFTFTAILNACQRADEAELALDVARLMKLHGVRMDESHANTLLRMCYNRLRQSWVPGGYPPHKAEAAGGAGSAALPGSRRTQERQRLLEALTPRGRRVELREPVEVAWLSQAFAIYREAVANMGKPSMCTLNRVLMCMRVAWEGKQAADGPAAALPAEALLPHQHPSQLGSFGGPGAAAGPELGSGFGAGASLGAVPRQEKIGVESVYHVQAVSILEEAIISNVVPSFKLDSDEAIDLRGMPPAVAEVYVLTVLSGIQRLCDARRIVTQNLVFLVPQYDGSKVFMPSHLSHIDYERVHADGANMAITAATAGDSFYDDSEDEEEYFDDSDAAYARAAAATECTGDERTGLGVAGVLRRLRLWAREYGERGFILLEAKELTRWCKAVQRAVERRSASALAVQKPYGQALQPPGARLVQQQHRIRQMGYGRGNTTFGSV